MALRTRRRQARAFTPNNVRSTLTASATKLTLDNRRIIERQASKRQEWQDEAWSYFDDVGELKFSVWYMGNVISKVRLFAAVRQTDDPDDDPVPVTDDDSGISPAIAARCQAELGRLRSPLGGRSEIVRELNMNLEIAAEAYLVGIGAREVPSGNGAAPQVIQESWEIKSVSEVDVVNGQYRITSKPGDRNGYVINPEHDTIIRIWQRHPRYSHLPDCNMRGVLGDCEALVLLANQVKAQAKSRMSAGYFTLPNDLSVGPVIETEGEDDEEAANDPLVQALYEGAVDPVEDPSSAAAVAPTFIRGPKEALHPDFLRHIPIHREAAATLQTDITAAVERLARGMNLPVETVMGHQATTFANAKQITEDEYEKHFRPRCGLICDALTVAFLQPNLAEAGVPPEVVDRLCIWFDPSGLFAAPDLSESADKGHEIGALSDETWRRVKGYSEDDAPMPEERLTRAVLSNLQRLDPGLSTAILQLLGVSLDIPTELPGTSAASAEASQVQQVLHAALRAASKPKADSRNVGQRLMLIDRELRSRLIDAADRALTRILERAGNRLRAKSGPLRDLARSTHPLYVAATVGPSLVASAGLSDDDLLSGDGWEALHGQFIAWCSAAQQATLDLIATVANVTPAARAQAEHEYEHHLSEAWLWFKDELHALSHDRLYVPDSTVDAVGESDPNVRVPAGLVRQAIARAGGASSILPVSRPLKAAASSDGDAFVALNNDAPLGGIGTGEIATHVLDDGGAGIDAWEWTYGPAFRAHPFEPHELLDEEIFQEFDDDVLVAGDWIGDYYFPGDHDGCVCDVTPIIVPADFFGDTDAADAAADEVVVEDAIVVPTADEADETERTPKRGRGGT